MADARRASGHHPLPYRVLAGLVPCAGGWLTITGRLHGVTLVSDSATVHERFVEVLERRPAFDGVGLAVPVGLVARGGTHGRACDRGARDLLGPVRGRAVLPAPPRNALGSRTIESARRRLPTITQAEFDRLPWIAEVDKAIHPYHQRTVREVHPELTFHQLNGNRGLAHPRRSPEGRAERRALLERTLSGIGALLDRRIPGTTTGDRLDAAAALASARRAAARAVLRLPLDGEWDDRGLRMEIVR